MFLALLVGFSTQNSFSWQPIATLPAGCNGQLISGDNSIAWVGNGSQCPLIYGSVGYMQQLPNNIFSTYQWSGNLGVWLSVIQFPSNQTSYLQSSLNGDPSTMMFSSRMINYMDPNATVLGVTFGRGQVVLAEQRQLGYTYYPQVNRFFCYGWNTIRWMN